MPLLNLLALCREEPPVVISIFDCCDHMSEGGKDKEYIGQLFKDKISEFDPTSTCTDAFFFDAMFKKLEKFSVQHIQGHFVSMGASTCYLNFFSDLSNFQPIKVSVENFYLLPLFLSLLILLQNLISTHTGCIISLGLVQVTGSMQNL